MLHNRLKNLKKLQLNFKQVTLLVGAWLNNLKNSFKHFDIKPQAPTIDSWLQQSDVAQEAGDYIAAAKHLRRALQCNNKNYTALLSLSNLCLSLGTFVEGIKVAQWAVRNYPDDEKLYQTLGLLHAQIGNSKASSKALQHTLQLNPNLLNVRHILDGVNKNHTKIAPRQYIKNLFNDFADTFEHLLLHQLDYRSYLELADQVCALEPLKKSNVSVLDLGCGTGLFGYALLKKVKINNLVGVDLSTGMLAKCQERNIYHQLHNSDIVEFLQSRQDLYDCITASDVFVYIGDLTEVMRHSYQRLVTGGYFAFTVEALTRGNYILTHTGRYQHSIKYLTALQKLTGYSNISAKTIDLRKEYGNMVKGYLVLLQK